MKNGYERFQGFANIYDEGIPHLPGKAIEIIKKYLKKEIDLIVDIGCGTGNSTEICTSYANKVIGIDPSEDMLMKAKEKANSDIQDVIEILDKKQNLIIYPTSQHLKNIISSNQFEYCKEICFCNEVVYDKEKFEKYFFSKGGLQNAIKNNYEPVISKLENLNNIFNEVFQNETQKAIFSYKMKIGIK